MCHHNLGTAVSRYDRRHRVLRSVVVCDSCGREIKKVGKPHPYQPAYRPHTAEPQPQQA